MNKLPPFLSGSASLPWAEGLNFVGPRVRTSFWGWALLAFGLIGVWHAFDLHRQSQSQLDDATEVVARLRRGAAGEARPVSTPVASGQGRAKGAGADQGKPGDQAPVLKDEGWRQAAQLALWMGHPWQATLDHVDATALQEGAVLMQFSLDLSSLGTQAGVMPEMRLQAAVIDDGAAWRWLQALGPRATMRSREPLAQGFSTARGAYALRVDVIGAGGQP